MRTQLLAGAFLTCGGDILLMHRGIHRTLAPGMWSCVGGHMEPDELNDPIETCYREIAEETGIPRESIENLRLRYITMRDTGEVISIVYYFIGNVTDEVRKSDLPYCDEGTLHWVKLPDMAEKEMTLSVKEITSHLADNPADENIYLCVVNREATESVWTKL